MKENKSYILEKKKNERKRTRNNNGKRKVTKDPCIIALQGKN